MTVFLAVAVAGFVFLAILVAVGFAVARRDGAVWAVAKRFNGSVHERASLAADWDMLAGVTADIERLQKTRQRLRQRIAEKACPFKVGDFVFHERHGGPLEVTRVFCPIEPPKGYGDLWGIQALARFNDDTVREIWIYEGEDVSRYYDVNAPIRPYKYGLDARPGNEDGHYTDYPA